MTTAVCRLCRGRGSFFRMQNILCEAPLSGTPKVPQGSPLWFPHGRTLEPIFLLKLDDQKTTSNFLPKVCFSGPSSPGPWIMQKGGAHPSVLPWLWWQSWIVPTRLLLQRGYKIGFQLYPHTFSDLILIINKHTTLSRYSCLNFQCGTSRIKKFSQFYRQQGVKTHLANSSRKAWPGEQGRVHALLTTHRCSPGESQWAPEDPASLSGQCIWKWCHQNKGERASHS